MMKRTRRIYPIEQTRNSIRNLMIYHYHLDEMIYMGCHTFTEIQGFWLDCCGVYLCWNIKTDEIFIMENGP